MIISMGPTAGSWTATVRTLHGTSVRPLRAAVGLSFARHSVPFWSVWVKVHIAMRPLRGSHLRCALVVAVILAAIDIYALRRVCQYAECCVAR